MHARRNDVIALAILGLFLVPLLALMGVRHTPPVDLDVYLRAGRMFATVPEPPSSTTGTDIDARARHPPAASGGANSTSIAQHGP